MPVSFKKPEALRDWLAKTTEAADGIVHNKGSVLAHSITLATAIERMVEMGIISRANVNQIKRYKGMNEGSNRTEDGLIQCIELLDNMFSVKTDETEPQDQESPEGDDAEDILYDEEDEEEVLDDEPEDDIEE